MTQFAHAICKRFKQVDCKLCKLFKKHNIRKSDPQVLKLTAERHQLMEQLLKIKMWIW